MGFDANVVIGVLTLLVTCAPGVLFLMRFRSRRRQLKENGRTSPRVLIGDIVCGTDPILLPFEILSPHTSVLFAFTRQSRCRYLVLVKVVPFQLNRVGSW